MDINAPKTRAQVQNIVPSFPQFNHPQHKSYQGLDNITTLIQFGSSYLISLRNNKKVTRIIFLPPYLKKKTNQTDNRTSKQSKKSTTEMV